MKFWRRTTSESNRNRILDKIHLFLKPSLTIRPNSQYLVVDPQFGRPIRLSPFSFSNGTGLFPIEHSFALWWDCADQRHPVVINAK